ncbi:MAG: hypothetical protein K2H89_02910 [Oscillospiraceae bacterium]|nr:hypothetical protein [Oscillospiraceae bacterium]
MESKRLQVSLILAAMTISAVVILGSAGKSLEQQKSYAVEQASALAEKEPVGFILKTYEGKIALFRENSEKPYQILDIEVYLLPDADRELLEAGILAETEEELKAILEDWEG